MANISAAIALNECLNLIFPPLGNLLPFRRSRRIGLEIKSSKVEVSVASSMNCGRIFSRWCEEKVAYVASGLGKGFPLYQKRPRSKRSLRSRQNQRTGVATR